jgi:hypothetical protein
MDKLYYQNIYGTSEVFSDICSTLSNFFRPGVAMAHDRMLQIAWKVAWHGPLTFFLNLEMNISA